MKCCVVNEDLLQNQLEDLEQEVIDINSPLAELHTVVYETRKQNSALKRKLQQEQLIYNGYCAEKERHNDKKQAYVKMAHGLTQEQESLNLQLNNFIYELENDQADDFDLNDDKNILQNRIELYKQQIEIKFSKLSSDYHNLLKLEEQLKPYKNRYNIDESKLIGVCKRIYRAFCRVLRFDFSEIE